MGAIWLKGDSNCHWYICPTWKQNNNMEQWDFLICSTASLWETLWFTVLHLHNTLLGGSEDCLTVIFTGRSHQHFNLFLSFFFIPIYKIYVLPLLISSVLFSWMNNLYASLPFLHCSILHSSLSLLLFFPPLSYEKPRWEIRGHKAIASVTQVYHPIKLQQCWSNVQVTSLIHSLSHQNFIEYVCFKIQRWVTYGPLHQAWNTNISS